MSEGIFDPTVTMESLQKVVKDTSSQYHICN